MYTITFHEANWNLNVGSKALNLIKMKQKNFPVPDGFVVKADAFQRFIEFNEINLANEHLQEEILHAEMPADVKYELLETFDSLKQSFESVAVRSSSSAEDLENTSFAGQYETYLNVKTRENLVSKVKACWASAFAKRVQSYLKSMNPNLNSLSMNVVIQGLVKSEVSGVIFSQNPITNDSDELMVNASYGLGEAIVSGLVTPDTFIIRKTTFETTKEMGLKELKVLSDHEGTKEMQTTDSEQNRYCINDDLIQQLAEFTVKLEEFYGYPVDIEFAIQNGEIYLLQTRPITTDDSAKKVKTNNLSKFQQSIILSDADKQSGFWVRADTIIPNAVSPLFASLLIPAFSVGTKNAFANIKHPSMVQFSSKVLQGHIYMQVVPYHGNQEQRWKEHIDLMGSYWPHLSEKLDEVVMNVFMPFYQKLDSYRRQNLTLDEARTITKELNNFYKQAWQEHFEIVLPQGMLNFALESAYKQLMGANDGVIVHDLLVGDVSKAMETDREMWKLSEKVKNSPVLLNIFREFTAEELPDQLININEGAVFMESLHNLLEEYGYRMAAHEFTEETWVENPEIALSLIKSLIENNYNFEENLQQTIRKRDESYQELLREMPENEEKQKFIRYFKWALKASRIKDDHHFYFVAMLEAKSRLFLLHVGDTLVKHDVIVNREDIFFLYLDELLEVLKNTTSVKDLIYERKNEFTTNQTVELPEFYGTLPKEGLDPIFEGVMGIHIGQKQSEFGNITGLAGSKGTHTGYVKIVRNQSEFNKVKKGDVLVCKTTTPSWTVLFTLAGSVITDTGGILSHSGIVAREHQIPAVVGTKIATSSLKDGDLVTVDGTNGVVAIEKQK